MRSVRFAVHTRARSPETRRGVGRTVICPLHHFEYSATFPVLSFASPSPHFSAMCLDRVPQQCLIRQLASLQPIPPMASLPSSPRHTSRLSYLTLLIALRACGHADALGHEREVSALRGQLREAQLALQQANHEKALAQVALDQVKGHACAGADRMHMATKAIRKRRTQSTSPHSSAHHQHCSDCSQMPSPSVPSQARLASKDAALAAQESRQNERQGLALPFPFGEHACEW